VRLIARVFDPEPVVDERLLSLTQWMAEEYACSWGEALAAVLPAPLKRERESRKIKVIAVAQGVGTEQLAELEERWPKQHRLLRALIDIGGAVELIDLLRRANLSESPAKSLVAKGLARIEWIDPAPEDLSGDGGDRQRPPVLSLGQRWAVKTIGEAIDARTHAAFLLQGVTGSGKTEVYLRAIEHALESGRGAIVLVPEISLTPQTVGWFRSRFGAVAVLHSRMTDAQRLSQWMRAKRGEARVVVGARSAIFAPVADLGVVVVDEEHEPSFKQASTPRYHARDVAIRRASDAGAVCILGSATPAIETWFAARDKRIKHLMLPERIGGAALPPVDIVDMNVEKRTGKGLQFQAFSRILRELLIRGFERGEQSILFLNRRGFTPVLWCADCHATVGCKRCSGSMSYHRRVDRLVCHRCCEERRIPRECDVCTSPSLRQVGIGSERVEAAMRALIPEARVRRMDSDTMVRREDYEDALAGFRRRELDVLVGTQMIAKGLDFPGVTLVGVVSADTSLNMPDFRATERTFQLIEQVAGRAGRGEDPGRIIVQTYAPKHPAVALAANHDFEGFTRGELENRRADAYPPFSRLLRMVFENESEEATEGAGKRCAQRLRAARIPETKILGPGVAPIGFVRDRHRHHVVVTCMTHAALATARDVALEAAAECARVRVSIDVDPVSMS
jgi:primosomal protein N' (replication factor Y)